MGGMTSAAVVDLDAIRSVLLANNAPSAERSAPSAGTSSRASRMDHVHERISWSGKQTTASDGIATFDFGGKVFDVEPVAELTLEATAVAGAGVTYWITGWTIPAAGQPNAGKYVGCKAIAQKAAIQLVLGINVLGAQVPAQGVKLNLLIIPASLST